MDFCRQGHALTEENTIYRDRNGRTYRSCRTCRRDTNARRTGENRTVTRRSEPPVTRQQAANSVTRPGETRRRPVVIGRFLEAEAWANNNGLHVNGVFIVGSPEVLAVLDPKGLRLVLLPSYTELDNFWQLQVEVRLLERRGAIVEKP